MPKFVHPILGSISSSEVKFWHEDKLNNPCERTFTKSVNEQDECSICSILPQYSISYILACKSLQYHESVLWKNIGLTLLHHAETIIVHFLVACRFMLFNTSTDNSMLHSAQKYNHRKMEVHPNFIRSLKHGTRGGNVFYRIDSNSSNQITI